MNLARLRIAVLAQRLKKCGVAGLLELHFPTLVAFVLLAAAFIFVIFGLQLALVVIGSGVGLLIFVAQLRLQCRELLRAGEIAVLVTRLRNLEQATERTTMLAINNTPRPGTSRTSFGISPSSSYERQDAGRLHAPSLVPVAIQSTRSESTHEGRPRERRWQI
jgi:hypothetical protein